MLWHTPGIVTHMLLTNFLINFIKFRHMEIPQFLRTILHLYSPIIIQESPLHIFLEDLLEGRSHQPLQRWSRRVSGALGVPQPWTAPAAALAFAMGAASRHVPYVLGRERGSDSLHLQKHNWGWEFWGGAGKAWRILRVQWMSKTRRFV